jgi:hypothetical protein
MSVCEASRKRPRSPAPPLRSEWTFLPYEICGGPCGGSRVSRSAGRRGPPVPGSAVSGKSRVLIGQLLQQRCRLERRIACFFRIVRQLASDFLQSDMVGVIHGASTIDRPSVSIKPHHVDVACPGRNAFFKDPRSFVDHRICRPLQDFLIADRAPLAPQTLQRLIDQRLDLRIGKRSARAAFVAEKALSGLLSEAASFT